MTVSRRGLASSTAPAAAPRPAWRSGPGCSGRWRAFSPPGTGDEVLILKSHKDIM